MTSKTPCACSPSVITLNDHSDLKQLLLECEKDGLRALEICFWINAFLKETGGIVDFDCLVDQWPDCNIVVLRFQRFFDLSKDRYIMYAKQNRVKDPKSFLIKAVEWERSFFSEFPVLMKPILIAIAHDIGGIFHVDQVQAVCHMLTLSKESFIDNQSIPDGFTMGTLKPEHTMMVIELWKYGNPIMKSMIEYLIQNRETSAVFTENGTCVGFMLQHWFGALGMLHVNPDYRRKGLATCIVKDLSRKLLDKGQTPWVYIETDVEESLVLHKKCGFLEIPGHHVVFAPYSAPSNINETVSKQCC